MNAYYAKNGITVVSGEKSVIPALNYYLLRTVFCSLRGLFFFLDKIDKVNNFVVQETEGKSF